MKRRVWLWAAVLAVSAFPILALGAVAADAQDFAYVTNQGSASVSVINTATNTVVAAVGVGSFPFGVALTPDGTRAYVANFSSASVSVIDTANNTVVATVGVGFRPFGVALTPDGTRAYVTNFGFGPA